MSIDAHTFARADEARVTHVDLDLTVDFDAKRLHGSATLTIAWGEGARVVTLDTRGLAIAGVTDEDKNSLDFTLGEVDPLLGQPLVVARPKAGSPIVIAYATGLGAPALDWLEPGQTTSGEPFLFTQGHAIETRSWIPTQDSPGIRQTYAARVRVPEGLVALMSAEQLGEHDGAFAFRMNEPIPPHLFALAVGDIAFRKVGPRTGVYAEPALVEAAAREFDELERMMVAAEALGGPYRWGRWDVLVMPPSFPYGGMENPRLTFASSSLLAGDRSLATVVAHELAHAWAGNLVTNATHDDFWLNEGFTVYVELRMNEALWGADRAATLRAHGFREWSAEVARQGKDAPDTRLRYDMKGRDPSVGVTVIPYLKGCALLQALEHAVGRPRFDAWLRGYFDRHAFTSIDTDAMLADVATHLFAVASWHDVPLDLATWIDAPGIPAGAEPPPAAALEAVTRAARDFLAGAPASAIDARGWSPQALRHFLGLVYDAAPADRVGELDAALGLGASTNAEIAFAWLRIAAKAQHAPALPAIERFLTTQGRGKFLRPIYAELLKTPWGAPFARRVYANARGRYHALVRGAVDRVMNA